VNRAGMLSNPRFKTGDYTVTRRAAPTYDSDGKLVPATPSSFTTGDASLQPPTGAALRVLPEGLHAEITAVLYTTAALQIEPVPDVVTVASGPLAGGLAVVAIAPWPGMGDTHYVVGLARKAVT
jgi:hypothetical protein